MSRIEDDQLTDSSNDKPRSRWLPRLLLAAKLAAAIGIGTAIVVGNDWAATAEALARVNPAHFIGSLLLVNLAVAITALRWRVVVSQLGHQVSVRLALVATFEGMFFNLFLPTSMGGDAVRAYRAFNDGVPTSIAIKGGAIDRGIGLAMVGALLLIGVALTPAVQNHPAFLPLVVAGAVLVLGALFAAALGKLVPHARLPPFLRALWSLVADFGDIVFSHAFLSRIAPLLIASSLLNCAGFWFCALALGLPLSFPEAIVVLMASSLAAMLPISIGGWGVREGTTALALVALGASVGDAAAASVLSGVGLLAIAAVGALAWLTHPYRKHLRPRFFHRQGH
jgi:uncharacterized membrane protein YbhN (UPF0104 family)